MNYHNAQFLTSVFDLNNAPERVLPEIVFAGRSNVGKSSMINKLLNRKALARTSSVPGKTASINYYLIDDRMYFADLPGYGYAKVSESEKNRWSELIEGYFNSSREITLVLLLIDIRHMPTQQDFQMRHFLHASGVPYLIILTKCDKLSKTQLPVRLQQIQKELFLGNSDGLFPFSAETGEGREELLVFLEECIEHENSEI